MCQALFVTGAAATYFAVRGLTEGRPGVALRNAHSLVELERFLGIDWESSVQQGVVRSEAAMRLLNWIYIFGHWPVIAVTLTWLVLRHPAEFIRARNAMLASGAVGMAVFAALPMAPPRLAGHGMVDTVTQHSEAYRVLQPAILTNQYAAMPSLHVGWDLIIGLAIITATNRLWLRRAALALPGAMVCAVLLTANHYILDVVAGAALASAAWMLARRWQPSRTARTGTAASPPAMLAAQPDLRRNPVRAA